MNDLTETRRAYDAQWDKLTSDADRAAVREQWIAAGWKLCSHGTTCPPWDCRT